MFLFSSCAPLINDKIRSEQQPSHLNRVESTSDTVLFFYSGESDRASQVSDNTETHL